ncbi:hypothetical protein KY290_021433 [Solanum tuberosum]|uniref:Uncharacterized protein n=1 Tax=Solanum tuberosum TaxID=4113 RepID=A0ABQ7V1I2_SOLTU|nr:hypothetical protein KY285_020347 [Solanum tuberosum]KAH0757940.1 hypothetical protein KY290_021433 [Solanum tuberosum]
MARRGEPFSPFYTEAWRYQKGDLRRPEGDVNGGTILSLKSLLLFPSRLFSSFIAQVAARVQSSSSFLFLLLFEIQ